MDLAYNAITASTDFSSLTETEKQRLNMCLLRLLLTQWTEKTTASWYRNRKLAVVHSDALTRYYGRLASGQWRLLLETNGDALSWKVYAPQWRPIEGA